MVKRRPRYLYHRPQLRIVLESQIGEQLDGVVGNHPVGRHGEHVHVACNQGLLGGVHPIGQVPVLPHPRCAEHLLADQFVTGDAGSLGQRGKPVGDEDVKAVRCDKDPLAGYRSRAGRFCSQTRQPADRGHDDKHQTRHTHANSVH